MAPVVRVEPNGSQALLTFDGAYANLEEFGWLSFIRKFDGFNMVVARQFTLSFDGGRAKVGDLQLEITEQSISLATGLPVNEEKWSKNYRVKDVPWTLLFRSRTVNSCNRGLPAKMLKPRWYDLLMILKQFITCEGRYGFVFLFHLRLLMVFMGFELNMPHYLHRSIFKMAKIYKRNPANTSLFHVGLIKMLVVSELVCVEIPGRIFSIGMVSRNQTLLLLINLWFPRIRLPLSPTVICYPHLNLTHLWP
jgi:hypothetical protein